MAATVYKSTEHCFWVHEFILGVTQSAWTLEMDVLFIDRGHLHHKCIKTNSHFTLTAMSQVETLD